MKKGLSKLLICLLTVLIIACGCSKDDIGNSETNVKEEDYYMPSVDFNGEDITITTKYGKLYYPGMWEEVLTVEQVEDGDNVVVHFATKIENKTFILFDAVIGTSEFYKIGEITDKAGEIHEVYLHTYDLSSVIEKNNLTDSEKKRIYSMQEDINHLIDSLNK